MKTITFYSYKGGVGRSLALANIATRLADFGKTVCLLDFDLEAPGLHYKFHKELSKETVEIKTGILDYIHQFANEGKLNGKISDFAYGFYNFNVSAISTVKTTLIPAGDTNSSDYWKKLSSINWNDLIFENRYGLAFLLNLKEKIKAEISPDFLLIDSRTGISEMSGITLSLLADEVVVMAANNMENIEGAKKIIKSISNPDNSIIPGKVPKITFVLSRIPFTEKSEDKAKEQILVAKIERELGLNIEVNLIHSDRELEEEEHIKIGYEKEGIEPQITRDYINLFEKLTIGEFTQNQIDNHKNIKDADREYQKAHLEKSFRKKLEYVNKAIDLNPYKKEFYLFRASVYEELEEEQQVINDCAKAINLDTMNIQAYELKGKTELKMKRYGDAKWAFEQILAFHNNHIGARLGLAEISISEKDYAKALEYYNDIIKVDGENATALTGRANVKLLSGNYLAALEDVYRALTYTMEDVAAFTVLSEINLHVNNMNEFYLNLERGLKLDAKWVETYIKDRKIHESLSNDKRFLNLIEKYNILPIENGN